MPCAQCELFGGARTTSQLQDGGHGSIPRRTFSTILNVMSRENELRQHKTQHEVELKQSTRRRTCPASHKVMPNTNAHYELALQSLDSARAGDDLIEAGGSMAQLPVAVLSPRVDFSRFLRKCENLLISGTAEL